MKKKTDILKKKKKKKPVSARACIPEQKIFEQKLYEQDRQCAYNVTLRRVRVTTVAV
jgi:hypothetical protein